MDLSPRAVIAGRYRVDTRIGAGGMGEVWLGEHLGVGGRVAVKTLLPAVAMNHEVVARFKREAFILGRIRSDHVARVIDFVPDDVFGLVLVMEFVDGPPLARVLQERTLTLDEGIDLAFGLAGALKDLHAASIVHRDLKPGNVIMKAMPDGRWRAVVVDFGVSRLMADKDQDEDEEITGITRANMAVGTIEYMAPEQILNSRNVTPGSDVYAAGAMLFRSCAGRHVFGQVSNDMELAQKKLITESPPLSLAVDDPRAEGFAAVVGRMIKRRPAERYRSAAEVLADLEPLRAQVHADEAAPTRRALDSLPDLAATMRASFPPGGVVDGALRAASPPAPPAPIHESGAPPATPHPATFAGALHARALQSVATQAGGGAVSPATPAGTARSALPPVASDSSISVSATHAPATPAPVKRGVSPLLTVALVAAALVGGALLGPRLLQPLGPIVARAAGRHAVDPGAAGEAPRGAATTPAQEPPMIALPTAAAPALASVVPEPSTAAEATGAADAGATVPAAASGAKPGATAAAASLTATARP